MVPLVSASVCPIETSVVETTSVAEIPPTMMAEGVAEELVKKPPPESCGLVRLKPPRSSTAPALTTIALVFGMASLAPSLSTPLATVTPAEPKPLPALTCSVPGPSLINAVLPEPIVELIAPVRVAVTAGAATVIVRVAAPRLTAPPRVRLLVLAVPPKVKSRLTTTGFVPTTIAALPARRVRGTVFAVVASPMVNVPAVVPRAVALFRISVPSWSFQPPVLRLALLSDNVPLPSLVICVVTPAWMIALMLRSGVALLMKVPAASLLVTVTVAFEGKVRRPETVATVAAL